MLAMKIVLLLVAALSAAEACVPKYSDPAKCLCGVPFSKRRIIGGVPAKVDQYPWQVALLSSPDSTDSFCGGSLLSSETVLTAAHCVSGFYSDIYVAFPKGEVTLKNAMVIKALKIELFPYYDSSTFDNDYAIITLSSPVLFDESTQPICLPNLNENYDDNLSEVTGWGVTESGPFLSEDLMTVNVTTMTNQKCNKLICITCITSSMICAADDGKDTCQGDSGGPMITLSKDGSYFSQIGIVSWGVVCAAQSSAPGVYSRVTQQLYWIMKQIEGETCAYPSA